MQPVTMPFLTSTTSVVNQHRPAHAPHHKTCPWKLQATMLQPLWAKQRANTDPMHLLSSKAPMARAPSSETDSANKSRPVPAVNNRQLEHGWLPSHPTNRRGRQTCATTCVPRSALNANRYCRYQPFFLRNTAAPVYAAPV